MSHATYQYICFRQNHTCCPTLSLSNSVAYLAGASSCEDINDKLLKKVGRMLKTCAGFYCRRKLTMGCWKPTAESNACPEVPDKCTRYNAAYTVFHYLLTSDIVCQDGGLNLTALRRTAVLLPARTDREMLPLYYDNFASQNRANNVTKVSAIDFGPVVKDEVFKEELFRDALFPAVAMAIVLVIILIFTGSLFVTLSSVLLSTSAMCLSYFVYAVVLNFSYFPFMNVTVVLVLLGMSADNVIVFHSAWRQYADEDCRKLCPSLRPRAGQRPLSNRVGVVLKTTMKHVAWSLFVTGFTTSAAFLSNIFSQVTAIKCFGLYAGLTVLSNLFWSLTWLPAAVVVHYKYFAPSSSGKKSHDEKSGGFCARPLTGATECLRIFFQHVQLFLIVRLRFLWILLFAGLAAGALYVVFRDPGLRLPDTNTYFQYFRSSHPFEVYALRQGRQFAFESDRERYMPVRIVLGVRPSDNGDHNNPDDKGSLDLRSGSRLSTPHAQLWLLKFCRTLRASPLFRVGDKYSWCFVESFKTWMETRDCSDRTGPCCQKSRFPFPRDVFDLCLKEAIYQLYITPSVRLYPWTPGPR